MQSLPYWRRRNGADHFLVLTADAGRCVHFLNLPRHTYGDVMVLQHHGAIAHVSAPEGKAAGGPPQPCYRPGHDILLPALTPGVETPAAPVITRRASPCSHLR